MLKIYLDTSCVSAYFDFLKPARQLMTQKWFQYNANDYELFVSSLVIEEIRNNPDQESMLNMLKLLDLYSVNVLEINDEVFELQVYTEHRY